MKKIFLSISLILGMILISNSSVFAQTVNVEVLSASDFVKNHGGGKYADVLNNTKNNKIVCGNVDTVCDRNSQVCLKCTYSSSSLITQNYESGKCVDKNSLNRDNLRASWGEDNKCPAKSSFTPGGGMYAPPTHTSAGTITVEDLGFLENNSTTALFWTINQEHEFSHNGHTYRLAINDNPKIVYGDSDNAHNGCEVLPVKIYNMQGCFFCPLTGLIFKTANVVTEYAFNTFARSLAVVIVVIFTIWLALLALGQVFSMTKQDAPKFFAAILKQGFKFALIYFLLANGNYLFKHFIIPLLDGGLALGTGIQTISMPAPNNYKKTNIVIPQNYYNISGGKDDKGNSRGTLYDRIELYLASLQARLSYMQAIGTTVFCVGSHRVSFWKLITSLSEFKIGLRMMMIGGILTSFAFLLSLAFAFYFLDAILQLAVIGTMLPFMIAGWPFKATSQYASTGFKMLLNTFFVMFFTGFVVSVNLELINQSLALSQDRNDNSSAFSEKDGGENVTQTSFKTAELTKAKEETAKGFEAITDAINNQDWNALNKATDIGGVGFLLLTFSCLFGFKFVAQTTPLASKLSSGGFGKGGIAGKIGTMAASATKGMATKAATPVAEAVADKYHEAGGLVGIVGGAGASVGRGVQALGSLAKEKGENIQQKGGSKVVGNILKFTGKAVQKTGRAAEVVTGTTSKLSKKIHRSYRRPGK